MSRNHSDPRRGWNNYVVASGVGLGVIAIGAGFVPQSLRPLEYLGIGYPQFLPYTHFIVAGFPLLAALLFRRSKLAAVWMFVATLVSLLTISSVPNWARSQTATVRVTRLIDGDAFDAWQKDLGFKVWEQSDHHRAQMRVDRTPGRAETLAAEAKRMGIWRP